MNLTIIEIYDGWNGQTRPMAQKHRCQLRERPPLFYNDELFYKADRMAWVYNVTEFRMATQLEDDGMLTIRNVFGFVVNQDLSTIHRKSFSAKKPHAGYFMAIRQFIGIEEQFLTRRNDIKDDPSLGRAADLGKRFKHPFGW